MLCLLPVIDYKFLFTIYAKSYVIDYYFRRTSGYQSTEIRISFKEKEYFATLKQENLSIVDTLSYVGGILGLFAGLSFLTIFEILYFLCGVKRNQVQAISAPDIMKSESKVKTYLMSYFMNTSIHSLNYVTSENKSCIKTIFWVILLLLSGVTFHFMFKKVFFKFHDETISLALDGTMLSVEKIPFPAITFYSDALHYEHQGILNHVGIFGKLK